MIGGMGKKLVECHDLKKNSWDDQLPQLNVSRASASCCVLNDQLYVMCGMSAGQSLHSVERIAVSAITEKTGGSSWELLEPTQTDLHPMMYPASVALNDTQIVILGGVEFCDTYLGDIIVYDPSENTYAQQDKQGGELQLIKKSSQMDSWKASMMGDLKSLRTS